MSDLRITLMCAVSLDGKLAPAADSSSRPYGTYIPESFTEELMSLRESVDGIMVGGETVRLDDSELLRPSGEPIRRIVIDSHGLLPADCTLLSDPHPATIAVSRETPTEYVDRVESHPEKSTIETGTERVDLTQLVDRLEAQGVEWIMLEGGGTLIEGMLRAKLIDDCRLLTMPCIVGDRDAVSLADGTDSLFPNVWLNVTDITEREGFVLKTGVLRYDGR